MYRVAVILGFIVAAIAVPGSMQGQSVTAFKTGERATGATKQCYYSFGTSEYTRTVKRVDLCPLNIRVMAAPSTPQRVQPLAPAAVTAFKTGERLTGMTKQCYYAFGSTEYTRTIQSTAICPLVISVRQ